MDAQPQHGQRNSPVHQDEQQILRLLQQQCARHMSQPQQPSPSSTHCRHCSPNHNTASVSSTQLSPVAFDPPQKQDTTRRSVREVVPGLPRLQTLKRQQSERREHLTTADMTLEDRRAVASDKKSHFSLASSSHDDTANSFATPSAHDSIFDRYSDLAFPNTPPRPAQQEPDNSQDDHSYQLSNPPMPVPPPKCRPGVALIPGTNLPDTTGMLRDEFDALIQDELENVWILNLSMHFRDRSKREKFFVTYRERDHLWRRVTISLDYRTAPPDALEGELAEMTLQRDKSAKIYEAIRDSLPDIQFYDTVTNLKLQTSQGRLHVHVVEDGNEVIEYPRTETLQHLNCWHVKESDINFDSHMSGFVYKVRINGEVLVKKEVPGRETIEEFLYEIHALHSLQHSEHVIRFRGLVTDESGQRVKALLIDYSPQGALVDRIYDECKTHYLGIPWRKRERWARQIIQGVADLHEAGFVQGDLTLANVVLDDKDNVRIIDVNRRGCPIGWEAPEAKPLMATGQRLTLYIGVKSDLFQLGMVLWALAMEEDEPEAHGRPLLLGPQVNIPDWYRQITEICLSHDPRCRLQASQLLSMIPDLSATAAYNRVASKLAAEQSTSPHESLQSPNSTTLEICPPRGPSPRSPMPPSGSSHQQNTGWAAASEPVKASYDDVAARAKSYLGASRDQNSMPTSEYDFLATQKYTIKPKSNLESGCFNDASKASTTPLASFPVIARAKKYQLDSADSGIFMRTNSESTMSRPSAGSQYDAFPQKTCTELLEDMALDDAAKSALEAILNRKDGLMLREDGGALDDTSSITASWISRSSSPDGDVEGGAQLERSDTAFSAMDTHFWRPEYLTNKEPVMRVIDTAFGRDTSVTQLHYTSRNEAVNIDDGHLAGLEYPKTSKEAVTAVIDGRLELATSKDAGTGVIDKVAAAATFDYQIPRKPVGTLRRLGSENGLATPLVADLKPEIVFESALWPDATRRFMTGAQF